MGKLIFKAEEVKKLVEHTKGKKCRDKNYEQPVTDKEYLYLVHDQGVYLMSGAEEPMTGDKPGRSFVAYAEGCAPSDEDGWENARDLVGGDDFAEVLPLSAFTVFTDRVPCPKNINVKLSKTSIQVTSGR